MVRNIIKKGVRLIVLCFFIFGLINISQYNDNVFVKANLGDLELTNWDDVASGLGNGTSNLIEFKSSCNNITRFSTYNDGDKSSPNSFSFQKHGSLVVFGNYGWWNLTNSYDYINSFSFNFHMVQAGSNHNLYMNFSNDTGVDNVILRYSVSSGWSYFKVGIGLTKFADDSVFDIGINYTVSFTHTGTNQFNFSVHNGTTGVLMNFSNGAGSSSNNWETFESINFQGKYNAGSPIWCFDDIVINTQGTPSNPNDPTVSNVMVDLCGNNYYVDQFVTFNITVWGDVDCIALVYIKDPNGNVLAVYPTSVGIWEHTVYFNAMYGTGTWTVHADDLIGTYTDSCTFTVSYSDGMQDVLDNMTHANYDFIDFYLSNQRCYYWVGSTSHAELFEIVYFVNGSNVSAYDSTLYSVKKLFNDGRIQSIFETGTISIFNTTVYQRLSNVVNEPGFYRVDLIGYYINNQSQTIINSSSIIEVCQWWFGNNATYGDDDGSGDQDGDGVMDMYDDDLNNYNVNILIGIGLSILIGGGLLLFSENAVAGAGGFFGGIIMFSRPELGILHFLPESIGIILAFVGALILTFIFLANRG